MRWFPSILAVAALAACADDVTTPDGDPWSLQNGADDRPDATGLVDVGPPEADAEPPPPVDAGRPDLAPVDSAPDSAACAAEDLLIYTLRTDTVHEPRGILARNGRVWASMRNDQGQFDIFEVVDGVPTRGIQLYPYNGDRQIIDGDESYLYVQDRQSMTAHRWSPGTDNVELGAGGWSYFFDAYSAIPRAAQDGIFAWFGADNRVYRWNRDRTMQAEALEGHAAPQPVSVHAGRVAFVSANPSTGVVVDEDGTQRFFSRGEFNNHPVLANDSVFWLSDGNLVAQAFDRPDSRVLIDQACGPPGTDGSTVVTACSSVPIDQPTWGGYLGARYDVLYRVSGGLPQEIYRAPEDTLIYAPVVDGAWVAWVEYGSPIEGYPGFAGTIRAKWRDAPPIDVAVMGNGCLWCDAYWPPPLLELVDGVLTWNYAMPVGGDPEPPDLGHVGYTQLWCKP